MATCSQDKNVLIFDCLGADDRRKVIGYSGVGSFNAARVSDGHRLLGGTNCEIAGRLMPSIRMVGHSSQVYGVRWSSNDDMIASWSRNELLIWDATTGRRLHLRRGNYTSSAGVAWRPDNSDMLVVADGPKVVVLDANTFKEIRSFKLNDENRPVESVGWSFDTTRIAAGDWSGNVAFYDFVKGNLAMKSPHSAQVTGIAWSPRSRRLATCSADGSVKVFDPATGDEMIAFNPRFGRAHAIDWSRDGQRIAVGFWGTDSSDNVICVWDAKALGNEDHESTPVTTVPEGG